LYGFFDKNRVVNVRSFLEGCLEENSAIDEKQYSYSLTNDIES